ncbi:thiolase family protein [Chitinasiproducens palmae]|uniref:Acetyl-CoA C-acetyltransferase n=1 Tax=Chitinasiproducens palmae TaxID=1770053 RepID=A0A1H2PNR4_9BURK|nr:beta-ketoacyl synthase N-terminal-like domain-containing protein [Chitinasiproducens palmae]SDV48304.1 acetyl-CoA C-acetyltransferase [Chitinasiproducens palmae]
MKATDVAIIGWARSAVAPVGAAFSDREPHALAAPVVQALLSRVSLPLAAPDALVAGNALGAGGNPARMVALAAGLADRCAALSVDTQCCAGLDAVSLAAAMVRAGSAELVVAGGVEAWSRAPLRSRRPRCDGEAPLPYERPAFAPDPARDPDMFEAAAGHAGRIGCTRASQDAYAVQAHRRALAGRATVAPEIVSVGGLSHDAYPRAASLERALRMPSVAPADDGGTPPRDCSVGRLAVSPKADGAAFVLLASAAAVHRLGLQPRAFWQASASLGAAPETPMLAAADAARLALQRAGRTADTLAAIELHDAFAAQALAFAAALGIAPEALNRHGGGLARGHPIGASGAIALVRALADLAASGNSGDAALAAVAGAGGVGAAAVVVHA